MTEITGEESQRHNAFYNRGCSLVEGEILLHEASSIGEPNWFAGRKLKKAIICFEQALQINPEGWRSMWALGKIYQRLGQPEESFSWFCRAQKIKPERTDVAREAGLAALDLGKANDALYYCELAVKLQPDDVGLVANLSWAHLISGNVGLAQQTIQNAVAAAPKDNISKAVLQIIDEVASGTRPMPKSLLEIRKPG